MPYTEMNMQKMKTEAIELLKRMIEIPSTSRNETQVANMIEEFIKEKGLTANRKGNNIWIVSDNFSNEKKTILLNAHIDTVKPVSAWKSNPYKATVKENKIIGLGSNDDGASVVSLLETFIYINTKEQNCNFIFLASCEEEVSGKNGIESVLPELGKIDIALVGEPTGMQPAIAEKGLMVVDVTVHGKAGHAARNEGENAIYKALDDINWIRNYHFEKSSNILGDVKATVTIINSGTQHNVIPDECIYTIDIRSNENYSNQEIFNTLKENLKGDPKARSFRLNSSKISPSHPLVERAIALGRTKIFGSPTLSDQALINFPSLKMGPGDSSRSHTAEEYILVEEIEEAIELYIKMLDGIDI